MTKLTLLILLLIGTQCNANSKLNLGQPTTKGLASCYGKRFQGRRMANGRKYNCKLYTAASTSYPLGTELEVLYPSKGTFVFVIIADKGPFVRGRILDLSERAANTLGLSGVGRVEVLPVHMLYRGF